MGARRPIERSLRAVHRLSTAGLLSLGVLGMTGAWAAASGVPFDESVSRVPVKGFLSSPSIEVTVLRPKGAGPFPIAVISHGTPRSADERPKMKRQRFIAQAQPFLELGFAVVVPTRRGYGPSDGPWAEGYGSCDSPDYYRAGLETARDVNAAVDSIRAEPWADAKRVVLVGHSAGGFGSLATASQRVEGLLGVVNFAGGRGSRSADNVCGEWRLLDAMDDYGKRSRVPALFIYSENDHFFGPALARRMYDAYVKAGGKAQLVLVPPSGADGHAYFLREVDDWKPRVVPFLRSIGAVS